MMEKLCCPAAVMQIHQCRTKGFLQIISQFSTTKGECHAHITEKKIDFLRGDVWKLQSPSRQCEKCTWGVKDTEVGEGTEG